MRRKTGLFIGLMLAVVVGFASTPVLANSLASVSEKLNHVAKDQTVDGSAYLAGETVTVDGTVKGDVYCAGQNMVISGVVEGDVLCAGQNVTIDGTVKGDVRLAGAKILIKGTVEGSASVTGADITTDSGSKIGRDAVVFGSQVSLSGAVDRDVMIGAGVGFVSSVVGRNFEGNVEKLTVKDGAKIGGNLSYTSRSEANVPEGAVAGSVNRSEPQGQSTSAESKMTNWLAVSLWTILSLTVLTVLLALVIPRYLHKTSDITTPADFGRMFVVGLVSFVVAPFIGFMLALTFVGILGAVVLLVAMLLVGLVSGAFVAYRVGRFMLADKRSAFMTALVGGLTLGLVGALPVVGWAVVLVSILIGTGMIVMSIKDQYSKEKTPVKLATSAKKTVAKKSAKSS